MSIEIGDSIPNMTLMTPTEKGPGPLSTDDIFNNKKVVLFAVPGAFTPTCSAAHLPGFVVKADEIKAKGVDSIVCTSVNDAFVMGAWGQAQNAEEILMLADGNGEFASAIGLTMDGSGFGMGTRSKRYAMIVDNGIVQYLGIDEKALENSTAEAVLAAL
ncbi:peroxiredoxin [Ketobacter sp. MCCC 1A13808]|uniref:peroxiredoxin n=1 Tax=Ketobacter sp. MCCC 1A13808 TaxID=2602738 RepID=UPI000F1A0CD7|nr:peroxiredoxin [Ketobacter sp. MCCC 1A13808]MVF11074.1 peroxiredoxin [Ketobacter sp. MCCC 1A13808]RLP56452.1 MAG: peroxiredoxin [Ketobacter sp.]|tara:strand:+ start:168 stop:644 length:477 start_codon:yes stop_codon:yes gene_type:complete